MALSLSTNMPVVGERRIGLVWILDRSNLHPGYRQRGAIRTVATASKLPTTVRTIKQEPPTKAAVSEDSRRQAELGAQVHKNPAVVPNAHAAARSLIAALNHRDVSAVLGLLAEDVTYENLGASTVLRGRAAVGRFYLESLAALPQDAVFVLEGAGERGTDIWIGDTAGPVLQAGLAWRVEINGVAVPLSRGLSVYCADPLTGRLARIWDNPEHAVKQAEPALTNVSWAAPLLQGLGPLVMPAAMSVTSFLSNLGPGAGEAAVGHPLPPAAAGAAGGSSNGGGGSIASAGIGGDLAGNVMSALTSMMPFQAGAPESGRAPAAAARGVGGNTVSSASGAVASTTSIAPSSSRGVVFRDHTRNSQIVATPAAAVPGAASAVPAAVSASDAAAAAAVRMRQLSSPSKIPASASVSVASSLASVDDALITAAALSATPSPAKPSPAATKPASGVAGAAVARVGSVASAAVAAVPTKPAAAAAMAVLTKTAVAAVPAKAAAAAAAVVPTKPRAVAVAAMPTKPTAPQGAANGIAAQSPQVVAAKSSRATTGSGQPGHGDSSSSSSRNVVLFGSVDSGSDEEGNGPMRVSLPFTPSTSLTVNLSGLWEKDLAFSQVEEYESMLDVLELGGLQKVTARLIDGLNVKQDEQRFEVSFVTVVPFFRVTEKSRFDSSTTMMRRDLRSGRQTAVATRIPGGVRVDMSWEAPLAGSLRETYLVSEDGTAMAVTSSISIGPRSAVATLVHRRSSRNTSDFLASKRSSYGSMQDVLQSQETKYGKIEY